MSLSESSTNPMSDRTKKRLITAAGVALIIIGAFSLYALLTAASREPYEQALARYEMLGKANGALTASGASLNASSADDEAFKKSVETAQTALGDVKTENEALGKEAVLQTGEGKELYETFNAMLEKYLTYNEHILSSMLVVRPIVYTCTAAMNNGIQATAEGVKKMRDCAADFALAGDVADADYKQLAVSFQSIYTDIANNLQAVIALVDPDGAGAVQKQTLSEEREQIVNELNQVSTTFKTNVQKSRAAILSTDADAKLEAYLKKKSSVIQL